MNVGIVSVDSKIPNLALMRLSAWHKAQGDTVEIAWSLMADTYDHDKRDTYQRRQARWCNRKAIFKTVEWETYR